MSNYVDSWYDINKNQIFREREAGKIRQRLVEELSLEDMVKLMFSAHLSKLPEYKIFELKESLLK